MRMTADREAFWELLEPEYERAVMFCRKLMSDREAGDDLFQNGLVAAYEGFGSLRDRASFRPWFYRILVNSFKMTVRRPWWKRRVQLDDDTLLNLAGDDPVDRHTARRWLDRAFKTLSPQEQALVTLHELEGWPVTELAGLYECSVGAIKTRLFRARARMKDVLVRASRPQQNATKKTANKGDECVAVKPDTE